MADDVLRVRSVRLMDEEWDWLGARAAAAGESRTEVIRQLIRAAMGPGPTVTVVDNPASVFLGTPVGAHVPDPEPEPEPERIPEVEALIAPDGPAVDAAIARHPAGKRRHDGHRTDSRSGGSCSGCRDCRGWSPIVAGGMRCKCGHPVRMH